MRTYTVNTIDTETPPTWMSAPHIVRVTPGAQDSGRCRYTVVTSDAEALEVALDADGVDYDQVQPIVSLSFGEPSPSTVSDTDGAIDVDVTVTIDGVVTEGEITLWRDEVNGGITACGTPPDVWVSGSIMAALRGLSNSECRAVLSSIEHRDSGVVEF